MRFQEIYEQCLTLHAHNWLQNYRSTSHIQYLEFQAGPILAKAIEKYGAKMVIRDFIAKTVSEK